MRTLKSFLLNLTTDGRMQNVTSPILPTSKFGSEDTKFGLRVAIAHEMLRGSTMIKTVNKQIAPIN